ncbi:hypothetical protein AR457_31135 [Streptomyces agglomeratus]|uniref:hypothetical protein n=1 Tax=Streptomyces agglomeratus TaxID=285458 RepID=UPI0008527A6C|nr:hypothetical protein [Streptomyces agglomeratus]OEJ37675.1 hypothetical protein BGK70_05510 [Streptomyces agglomeratus]OEJ47939.1 hypothetical protein AR457_31135 [Streptomyces agglomeratus]OEJ50216.1 hypothetical protein BGK72_05035 [Streptomyces agglomeratus]OEJ57544.1 hypothetical protein BGM19_05720 [Streptomyces agglomeratus]
MSDPRTQEPEDNGTPVPRDLPDQQAPAGEDPAEEVREGPRKDERVPGAGGETTPDEPSG